MAYADKTKGRDPKTLRTTQVINTIKNPSRVLSSTSYFLFGIQRISPVTKVIAHDIINGSEFPSSKYISQMIGVNMLMLKNISSIPVIFALV